MDSDISNRRGNVRQWTGLSEDSEFGFGHNEFEVYFWLDARLEYQMEVVPVLGPGLMISVYSSHTFLRQTHEQFFAVVYMILTLRCVLERFSLELNITGEWHILIHFQIYCFPLISCYGFVIAFFFLLLYIFSLTYLG